MGVVLRLKRERPKPRSLDAYRLPPHRQYWQPKTCQVCGKPVHYEGGEWWSPEGYWHNIECEPKRES